MQSSQYAAKALSLTAGQRLRIRFLIHHRHCLSLSRIWDEICWRHESVDGVHWTNGANAKSFLFKHFKNLQMRCAFNITKPKNTMFVKIFAGMDGWPLDPRLQFIVFN